MRRTGAFIVVVAGFLAALAVPSAAHAAVGSGFAYVWANQPGVASYDPSPVYSFNSTGATNHVVRIATGQYEVQLPNLGVSGGVAHASAYGTTTNTCQVGYWNWSDGVMAVRVNCFNGGLAADTMFTATFTNRPTTTDIAYLLADQPGAATYTPNPTFQFNSTGGLSTIQRMGTGYYQVTVPGLLGLGDVQVTGYGFGVARCSVSSWASLAGPGYGGVVFVRCVNAVSVPTDDYFTLTTVTRSGFLGRVPASYARVDPPAPLSRTTPYAPTSYYNSAGGVDTVTRVGIGRYLVTMPGQPLIGGTVNVTAYSFGTERCNAVSWVSAGVTVQCWQGATAYDSPFTVAFQS